MGGISGIVLPDANGSVNREMLKRMTDIIRHRGPDGEGFHIAPGVGLGMRHLSVIDLETGDQPISNEDSTITVVCNGRIYNYLELREELLSAGHKFRTRSDTEVIVHMYEDYGVECLQKLRGMFAFALWNAKIRQILLARDRLGIKPLHFAIGKDGSLYFGSELKSILVAGQIKRQIDPQALKDLFTFGFILSPKTLFSRISRVLPGHYILYRNGDFSIQRYWQLSFPRKGEERMRLSARQWEEAILEKLEESVRIHLRSDVPVGAWLSGGIDSSTIVALTKKLSPSPVQTFSLAFEDQPLHDEVTNQRTLDEFPGFEVPNQRIQFRGEHFNLLPKTLWHVEDPDTLGVYIGQMILSEETSSNVKVVLAGEGSDEIFGGYPWNFFNKLCRPFSILPLPLRRLMLLGPLLPSLKPWASQVFLAPRPMNLERYAHLIGLFSREILDRVFSGDLKQKMRDANDPPSDFFAPAQLRGLHSFSSLQYIEMNTRLVDFVLHGLDRVAMAHSLEARVPFLDHELVELCAHIPPSLKMRGSKEKYILRKAMGGRLPPEILKRKKHAFSAPSSAWLRGELPEFAMEMLSRKQLRDKGYFNPEYVADLLAKHRTGKANYTRPLMAILGIQIWDKIFMHGCQPAAGGEHETF